MYEELLRIKRFREESAAHALTRQQRLLEERSATLQKARDEVASFHQYRIAKEQQLFENIKGQAVLLRAIDTMKQQVALLREQEATLESEILVAQKRLEEAKQALGQARSRHLEAVREHEKFEQFIEVQRAAQERERAMKEETELEESAGAGQHAAQMME
jgi:type III secretion protein O